MWVCKFFGHNYWSSVTSGYIYCTRCGVKRNENKY